MNDVLEKPASRPPLFEDKAFWGMTSTQFLGAFNDNLFKQLMLLLAVPVGAAAATESDQQGLATVVFSLPFILFSGYAGFLSDRYRKRTVIVYSKAAEIVVMALGLIAFAMFAGTGYAGLLVVLFLMGTQSAFFGPGKYGILPEMLRDEDLPRANGIIVMTTFLAIIFGTASAGLLKDIFAGDAGAGKLWIGSAVCVVIALAGTATSFLIRLTPPANRDLKFQWSSLAIPPDTRAMLWNDPGLVITLLATCIFWLVAGAAMQIVNSLGRVQLGLDNFRTSLLTAVIGLGIAIGAVVAGRLCRGKADFRVVRFGLIGMFFFLLMISISFPGEIVEGTRQWNHLLGFYGSMPVLVLMGAASGMFAIPLQVFLQSRPPDSQKGRIIAVLNQANFTAILISGVIYGIFSLLVDRLQLPRSAIFAFMSLFLLPVLPLLKYPEREMKAANP